PAPGPSKPPWPSWPSAERTGEPEAADKARPGEASGRNLAASAPEGEAAPERAPTGEKKNAKRKEERPPPSAKRSRSFGNPRSCRKTGPSGLRTGGGSRAADPPT